MVLIIGIVRGRKRGISEELLDVIKWVLILAGAAYFYEPLGTALAQNSVFSLLSCYVAVYAVIAGVVLGIFAYLRRRIGDKLIGSDAFGSGEYYLGMAAGLFRYACILLVILAFMNARYFSPEEIQASQQYQEKNYGSQFFPSFWVLQSEVFSKSLTGTFARDHLSLLLIRPTAPEDKSLGNNTTVHGREKQWNQ